MLKEILTNLIALIITILVIFALGLGIGFVISFLVEIVTGKHLTSGQGFALYWLSLILFPRAKSNKDKE